MRRVVGLVAVVAVALVGWLGASCAAGETTGCDPECEDDNPCTSDSCFEGHCSHSVVDPDDEDDCTLDSCDPVEGVTHTPDPSIDDGLACTVDSCDAATGIKHEPHDELCDDADGVSCTTAVCEPTADGANVQGCVETPDDSACDDGEECTTDVCDPTLGAAPTGCASFGDNAVCDDGVGCTEDVCTGAEGCESSPSDEACDDGFACDPVDDCQPTEGPGPTISAVAPDNTPVGAAGELIVISGTNLGLDAQVTLAGMAVPTADCDYDNIPTSISCAAPANTIGVRGDVVVENTDNQDATLADGFTYTISRNETNDGIEADFCNIQFPLSFTIQQGQTSPTIYGRIFEAGMTPAGGANPAISAEVGFGPDAVNPTVAAGFKYVDGTYNVQVGNDDEYQGTFVGPQVAATTTFRYVVRFSLDDGLSYTYCDLNGAGSDPALTFEPAQLGTMTVNP